MNLPRLTRRGTADYVLSALKKSGYPPKPGSRIQQMYDIYLKKQTTDPEDEDFETVLEVVKDMQLLHFIFEQSLRDSKRKNNVLKKLTDDSVLP